MSELSDIAKQAATGSIPSDAPAPTDSVETEADTKIETEPESTEVPTTQPVVEETNEDVTPDTEDDEEDTFIIGKPKAQEPIKSEVPEQPAGPKPVPVPVEGADVSEAAAVKGPSKKEILIMRFNKTKQDELKKLVLTGLTPEEAEQSLQARLAKALAELDESEGSDQESEVSQENTTDDTTEEAPVEQKTTSADVIIDKATQNPDDLGLTKEEHDKLIKVRQVRLITVEDADLKTIPVEDVASEHKADFIRGIEGTLSQYGVPLPILGDFIPFKGAQVIQLAQAIDYEDERVEDAINKKASLVYDKMMNGTVFKKYGPDGKVAMSYGEFVNKFPYQDLDMAIYGILCASTMEESSASLTCAKCNHTWEQAYNVKTIMQTDGLSEAIMQRYEDILANKGNEVVIRRMYDETRAPRRYKSPFTNNVYDVSSPSVGRAIDIMKRVDQTDKVMVYNSALAMFLSKIYVYNAASGKYIEIKEDETDLTLQTVLTLPDEDTQLLLSQINDHMTYDPKFAIPSTCPSCKADSKVKVEVSNLVFLRARDSFTEIR